jgi:hypothetical protein
MGIEDIKQTDLTQNERDVLAADAERWKRMGAGAHLNDWLNFHDGLAIRRRLAMKIAHTNRPAGGGYNLTFNFLMQQDGIDTSDKSVTACFTAVMWLHEEPERLIILRQILDAMTPGQRARLQSPISARQRVNAVLKARAKGEAAEAKVKESPVALLRKQVADRDREIDALKAQLAKADEGSLFDLKRDKPGDIGEAIVGNVSDHRAGEIERAIGAARKRRNSKPAG